MALLTIGLRGHKVLAKYYKGEVTAITYVNRKQAYDAAARYNGTVYHWGRPFYVAVDLDSASAEWAKPISGDYTPPDYKAE